MLKIVSTRLFAGLAIVMASAANAQQPPPPPPPPPPPSAPSMSSPMDAIGGRLESQQRYDQMRQEKLSSGLDFSGYEMSRAEMKQLRDLEKRIAASDSSAAVEASARASAAMQSPGSRYVLGALQLQLAAKIGDVALQARATDLVIDSGLAPPTVMPQLLRNQGIFALDAQDLAKAESSFARLVQISPTDADATVSLAQIKADAGKPQEAAKLFEDAIRLKRSTNQPVPDIWLQAEKSARAQAMSNTKR